MDKLLESLEKNQKTVIFKVKHVRKKAYQLRQATKISSEVEGSKYGILHKKFRFKEGKDCIICIRNVEIVDDSEPQLMQASEVTSREALVIQGVPHPEVKRIEDVVGACLESPEMMLSFPNFSPSTESIAMLEKWGSLYNFEFFLDENTILIAKPR